MFLGIINYLGKFSPSPAEVGELLRKLISPKCKWAWNNTYYNVHDRGKNIIKKTAAKAFYSEKEQLYLATDVSGLGLGASLLQVWDRMQFPKNEVPKNAVLQPIPLQAKAGQVHKPITAT